MSVVRRPFQVTNISVTDLTISNTVGNNVANLMVSSDGSTFTNAFANLPE